jgi:hypothetical protein
MMTNKQIRGKSAALLAGVVLGAGAVASANAAMSFSATSGSRSAQAEFDIISGNLVVTLKNTSGADVLVPSEILTALFFDISGSPVALTPVSALLAPGSVVWFDTPPAGGNVGGEWAYGSGLVGAPMGAKYGISSAGFGLFGQFNFNGPDLDPPPAVNGLNYGITSAGDNMLTGNSAVTGGNPLIHNAVTFTLSGAGAGSTWVESATSASNTHGSQRTEHCRSRADDHDCRRVAAAAVRGQHLPLRASAQAGLIRLFQPTERRLNVGVGFARDLRNPRAQRRAAAPAQQINLHDNGLKEPPQRAGETEAVEAAKEVCDVPAEVGKTGVGDVVTGSAR